MKKSTNKQPNNAMTKVLTKPFYEVLCDIFMSPDKEHYMTREQIGEALEYTDPMVAIAKIHDRHTDRLESLSFTSLVNGRHTYYYSLRGVMEVCRFSRQPKADEFIDFVWDIMESLYSGNSRLESNDKTNLNVVQQLKRIEKRLINTEECTRRTYNITYYETHVPYNKSEWKAYTYELAEQILELQPEKFTTMLDVLKSFYTILKCRYKFDFDKAQRVYKEREQTQLDAPYIDLIEADTRYKNVYQNLMIERINKLSTPIEELIEAPAM